MLQLRISLISTCNGLKVIRTPPASPTMVLYSPHTPLYVYQWKIPFPLSKDMIMRAHTLVSPCAVFMKPENLHCTAHVSRGPEFEELFFHDVNDLLLTSTLFWSVNWCAVSVSLTPTQQTVYTLTQSQPHISLSKPSSKQWRDVGPFVLQCSKISEPTTDPHVLHSPSTGVYRTPYQCFTQALRSVFLLDDTDPTDSLTLSSAPVVLPPELQALPGTLWAKGKYDVGLIKNCEPITPKSSFRPCKPQYPLKQEAIDGITPVFP